MYQKLPSRGNPGADVLKPRLSPVLPGFSDSTHPKKVHDCLNFLPNSHTRIATLIRARKVDYAFDGYDGGASVCNVELSRSADGQCQSEFDWAITI